MHPPLTDRERQVLALLADGRTNREIGAALYMSPKTASVHVTHILEKLGVQTRVQAAARRSASGSWATATDPRRDSGRDDMVPAPTGLAIPQGLPLRQRRLPRTS